MRADIRSALMARSHSCRQSRQALSALEALANETAAYVQWRDAANMATATFDHAWKELLKRGLRRATGQKAPAAQSLKIK